MNEDTEIKKNKLKKNLYQILESIEKINTSQVIPIYESLILTGKDELEKIHQPAIKCKSCGEPLEKWEKETCGPCKISDNKYQEDE